MGWKSICHFTYWDAAYLLLITITTIGLRDVHPKTVWAQMLTLGVMVFLTISLPPEFNLYTDMSSRASKYSGSYNNPSNNPHVLVCGDIDTRATMRFLKFFMRTTGMLKISLFSYAIMNQMQCLQPRWQTPIMNQGSSI